MDSLFFHRDREGQTVYSLITLLKYLFILWLLTALKADWNNNPRILLFFLMLNYFPFRENAQLTVRTPLLSASQQPTTLCACVCAHSLLCVRVHTLSHIRHTLDTAVSYSSQFGTTLGACVQINTHDVSFLWSLIAITNSVYSVSPWSECENILALSITKVAHPCHNDMPI